MPSDPHGRVPPATSRSKNQKAFPEAKTARRAAMIATVRREPAVEHRAIATVVNAARFKAADGTREIAARPRPGSRKRVRKKECA